MEIDEKTFEIFLQKPLNFESREEEEEEDSHRDGSKIEEFSDASVQSNIEDFSSSHTSKADLKTKKGTRITVIMQIKSAVSCL